MAPSSPNQLVPTIASESLSEALTTIADTSLDVAITSGVLDGIPVVGILTGTLKAARDIREVFLFRKLLAFLQQADRMHLEERQRFEKTFADTKAQEDFGAALLVLIDRAEDLDKPRILGRLLVAHARGAFDQATLMRLSKMVDRCYVEDLGLLRSFTFGLMPQREVEAQNLASQGFLYQAGMDGGDASGNNGGILYQISPYGQWLTQHGLGD
jgi:hypothetical protein